ncbi:MAG: response regulator [Anaerolineae bacterium]|nr:response regulator [Anaerolineae bacterium]
MNALHDLWRRLTEPGELDPDEARHERLTRIILVMMEISVIAVTLLVFLGWAAGLFWFSSVIQALLIDLPVVIAAWLVYTGRWRAGTYLLPAALLVNGASLSYLGGFGSTVVFYILAIMLAGILHGIRAQWFTVGLSLVVHVVVSWIAGDRAADVVAVGTIMSAVFFTSVTLLQVVVTTQFEHALAHAREYASEVSNYQNHLEDLVARYEQLVNSAPAGICEIDLTNFRFISVNDIIVNQLGYTRDELLAMNPLEILPFVGKEAIVSRLDELLGESVTRGVVEYRIRSKNGRELWALLNAQILTDTNGTLRARVVAHDITARKEMEEKLRRSVAELENLQHITDALLRLEELPAVMNSVAEGIVTRLGHDFALVTRYDEAEGAFRGLALHPPPSPKLLAHLLTILHPRETGRDGAHYAVSYTRGDDPIVDRVLDGEMITGHSLADCVAPWIPRPVATAIQRMLGLHTLVNVPMQVKGMTVGTILVGTSSSTVSTPQIEALTRVGRQAAVAVEKARLFEAERQRSDELARSNAFLTALSQVAARIESTPALDQVLDTLSTELRRLGLTFFLTLVDHDSGEIVGGHTSLAPDLLARAEALAGIDLATLRLPLTTTSFTRAVERGEGQFVPDFIAEAATVLSLPPNSFEEIARIAGIDSRNTAAYLPLRVEHNVLGLMTMWGTDLHAEDVPALSVFANQVAIALQNARLVHNLEWSLQELQSAQDQLVQAHKMEAIGRLAGGVAHDFNNLLTIIGLGTRLIDRALHPADPLRDHLQHIQSAGERGMRLTRQLLSFSRREAIKPQVLDLNRTVTDLSHMLRRVMGEDVDLVLSLASELDMIQIDPSQMEQVIINLAVNARDAMPRGGRLLIATTNTLVQRDPGTHDRSMSPGRYVRLSVTDTGTGMSEAVRAHLFEPFFTTKDQGEGTGLGLPTVYGIVTQNQGHVKVSSEIDQGTTFDLFFPPLRQAQISAPAPSREAITLDLPTGSETILLVEDEASVRRLAAHILGEQGYRVLAASDGPDAIRLATRHDGPIHLLLTDVVMPGMNGKELVEHIQALHPNVHILFMSGYSGDVIAHHDVSDHGRGFLAKPFTLETLTHKVRAALGDTPGVAEQAHAPRQP